MDHNNKSINSQSNQANNCVSTSLSNFNVIKTITFKCLCNRHAMSYINTIWRLPNRLRSSSRMCTEYPNLKTNCAIVDLNCYFYWNANTKQLHNAKKNLFRSQPIAYPQLLCSVALIPDDMTSQG